METQIFVAGGRSDWECETVSSHQWKFSVNKVRAFPSGVKPECKDAEQERQEQ